MQPHVRTWYSLAPPGTVDGSGIAWALGIPTGGLDVPIRERADPDISPGGRDGKRLDPPENVRLREPGAVGEGVGETFAGFSAADAGARIIDISQAG
jgi:hypothetical protein